MSDWHVGMAAFVAGALLSALLFGWRHRALRVEARNRAAVKAELRYQLAFQRAMLDAIPHAICVRDHEARLISCNVAFEQLFETTREEVIGKTVVEPSFNFVERDRREGLHRRYLQLLAERGTISEDVDVRIQGRPYKIFHWAAPVSLSDGEAPVALVAGAIDVNERHHLIEQLESARTRAEAASRAKSNFLATMSHEIRTPMNAVMGMLDLLVREGRLNAADRASAELARDSAEALLGLIDDILDISKIEAGGLEIVPATARLRPLVSEVAQVFQGLARQRGLTLRVEFDPAIGEWHRVDAARFKQIANNLVSNAIKYTDAGTVTIRLRRQERIGDDEALLLEVEDTGIGIAPEDITNLFRPFFQAESAGPRAIRGTGLGLPIVQRLSTRMGGEVEVTSQRGQGTSIRVSLTLPLAPAPDAAPPAAEERARPPAPAWTGRGFKVLAVDDHPANRLLMQRQLAHLGLECELAEDGESALALWRDGGFDLVLTDCSMQPMDGYALAEAIRSLERERGLPRSPVLGCTAHVQEEDRRHALAAGMDECLMKPLSVHALSAALQRHLAGGAAEAPAETPALSMRSFSGGDVETEVRFLNVLLVANQADLQELAAQVEAADWLQAADRAHRIKGVARLVAAAEVDRDCERLERACKEADPVEVRARLADLVASVGKLDAAIRVRLAGMVADGPPPQP